jgi:hypothetical protein
MNNRTKKVNIRLIQLGKNLGISQTEAVKAKRTIINITTLALLTGTILLLGQFIMTGGPAGLYYTGVSIKDFKILFGGFF